jgi:cytochrome c oxidase subunit 2
VFTRLYAARTSKTASVALTRALWFQTAQQPLACVRQLDRNWRKPGKRAKQSPFRSPDSMKAGTMRTALRGSLGLAAFLAGVGLSAAQEITGRATPGELGLQPSVSTIADEMHWFYNDILTPIVVVICIFVAALLGWCIFRFNERAHPVPSRTTHHSLLEVVWTIAPVLILVVIAIPSFRLLTDQVVIPDADLTVKVTGHQWYWSYAYPDPKAGFEFDSFLKDQTKLGPDDIRLLSVDNEAVVPVNKTVRVQVTSTDVLHGFVVQAFGIRIDAVPGRLNETWFKAERVGTYYGQCSLICGQDHAYMPIVFKVVTDDQYRAWLAAGKQKFASLPMSFAANDAVATR